MKLHFTERQIYLMIAVAVPGATIVGARFMGSGASAAEASPGLGAVPKLPEFTRGMGELTEDAAAAIQHATQILTAPSPRSPFPIPAPIESGSRTDDADRNPGGPAVPDVTLTSVAKPGRFPVAVIDGRARARGQTIAPGWKIQSINIPTRSVTLVHDSGVTAQLTLDEFRSTRDD